MQTYTIILLVVACVVLGLSIWAFVTRCNTDKFGAAQCIDSDSGVFENCDPNASPGPSPPHAELPSCCSGYKCVPWEDTNCISTPCTKCVLDN